jgi:hypothetical protein
MRKNLNMKRIKSRKQSLDTLVLSKALAAKVVGGANSMPESIVVFQQIKVNFVKANFEHRKVNATEF